MEGAITLNCSPISQVALWLALWTLTPAIVSSNLSGTKIFFFSPFLKTPFKKYSFRCCNTNIIKHVQPCYFFSVFTYLCVNTSITENSFTTSIPVQRLAKAGISLVTIVICYDLACFKLNQ